ncbi:hypothetical protein IJ579_08705 [bacterium]|nr:hypothetical protein [bacterium]
MLTIDEDRSHYIYPTEKKENPSWYVQRGTVGEHYSYRKDSNLLTDAFQYTSERDRDIVEEVTMFGHGRDGVFRSRKSITYRNGMKTIERLYGYKDKTCLKISKELDRLTGRWHLTSLFGFGFDIDKVEGKVKVLKLPEELEEALAKLPTAIRNEVRRTPIQRMFF